MSVNGATPLAPHPVLSDYYDDASRRQGFVRSIFDDTAPWYDRIIALMSFGSGNWYRADVLSRHGLLPGMKILDVATGTGVVARAACKVRGDRAGVVGLDPSIGMLLQARQNEVSLMQAGAESLPVRDASFDMITVGFALRHFADLRVAFAEFRRVLRPGGTLLILEITPPRSRFSRAALGVYMGRIVPLLARIWTGRNDAATLMRYYWDTTRTCVPPDSILSALSETGFSEPRREISLTIFSEYSARA